mgnify:CR=1 FL=1
MNRSLLVVIPAFNEEKMIRSVIGKIPKRIKNHALTTVVIDDGSMDNTSKNVLQTQAILIRHLINRGLGGALGTGFAFAKSNNFDIMVTIDADGQHDPSMIKTIIEPIIENNADVVIGSRMFDYSGMPMIRRFVNGVSNVVTYILFGVWTTDSQSGFRAFSKKAIQKIHIQTQRMEVSSEIFKEIKENGLKKEEIQIPAIYTAYSLRKGQQISNAPNVFLKLLLTRFRAVLDY